MTTLTLEQIEKALNDSRAMFKDAAEYKRMDATWPDEAQVLVNRITPLLSGIRALIAAGYWLAPGEATEEMMGSGATAYQKAMTFRGSGKNIMHDIYTAMRIAAMGEKK